jgi:hypothetical protein
VDQKKIIPITQSSLFEDTRPDTLQLASSLGDFIHIELPVGEKHFLLGTSAFTANGWAGSFYPAGMNSRDYLPHYASQFQTVEVDSTFYATPSANTVTNWHLRRQISFSLPKSRKS